MFCKPINKDYYFLPGGHVEFFDSLETTLYKELEEEIGIKKEELTNVTFINHLEKMYGEGGQKRHELNMVFSAELTTSREINSLEDHIVFDWVNISDIQTSYILPEGIKQYLMI